MSNPYEIELVTTQFTATLQMLLQQMDTRLRGSVQSGTHVGKQASPVQYIGALQFKDAGGRGTPLLPQIPQYSRRWVFPMDKDLPVLVDTFDELRSIVDPKSAIVQAINSAANRLFDDVIISQFFATAQVGADAASLTTETYNSGATFPFSVAVADTFGVGSATGLTAQKIIEGKRILRQYENDMDTADVHMAIGNQQESDLLKAIEVINRDYNTAPVMEDGKLRRLLGVTFHHSERLTKSGGDRLCPMWLADGMYLGIWKEMETIISRRTDLVGHPWQAYSMVSLGATRLQPGKVVQVSCLDATSAADLTV